MGQVLERIRERRIIRDQVISTYHRERNAGKSHDEAADAVISMAKETWQPRSGPNSPVSAIDIERWMEIIKMIMTILTLFV